MFDEYEEQLEAALRRTDSPFLGLLGGLIPADARERLRSNIRATPGIDAFVRRLELWPALSCVWLAESVMRGLGAAGHFDVYRHIQDAIGAREPLSSQARERLWRAFRRALLKLGIEPLPRLGGPHYMVDEYVRQAGVPLAFVDDLARRMLALARRAGLPDEDDQDSIRVWQATLASMLAPPFSTTARRAVEADTLGFYTREFLRLYGQGGEPQAGSSLQVAMAAAFRDEGGARPTQRAAIPYVRLSDSVLGVFFPGGPEREYEIESGGRRQRVRVGAEARFILLNEPLPLQLTVRTGGETLVTVPLWNDRAANRILVFDEAGRLKARAQLGQEGAVELPPGRYTVLSRFRPAGFGDNAFGVLSEEPRVVMFEVTLKPTEEHRLQNGPASVTLAGQNLPRMSFASEVRGTRERTWFRFGELTCLVSFPLDWMPDTGRRFVLRTFSLLPEIKSEIFFELDTNGEALLSLTDLGVLARIPSGLYKVVVEIARAGEARTQLRESFLYWKGLRSVSDELTFFLDTAPANLVTHLSDGFRQRDDRLSPAPGSGRTLRLAFEVRPGAVEVLSFTRPGIHVDVEVPQDGGEPLVLGRQIGSVETVSIRQNRCFLVSATEPGSLSLGSWSQHVDFAGTPCKRLPAAFLASRIEPHRSTLRYRSDRTGLEFDLLQLRQLHVVAEVMTSNQANRIFEIRLVTQRPPQSIALRAKDVFTGNGLTMKIGANANQYHEFGQAWLVVSPRDTGESVCLLRLDVSGWPAGAWVLSFEGQIDDNWGRFEDEAQAAIGVGFACSDGGMPVTEQRLLEVAGQLDAPVRALARAHAFLQTCWSPKCWPTLRWLNAIWFRLARGLSGREEEELTTLADLVAARPSEPPVSGWLPQQAIEVTLPRVFGLRRDEYRRVNERRHPTAVALRAIAALSPGLTASFSQLLDPVAATAFENAHAVAARNVRPAGFSCRRFSGALRQSAIDDPLRVEDESHVPGAGELLGAAHLRHAWRTLEREYDRTLSANEARRGVALAVCRRLRQARPAFDHGSAPRNLQGQSPFLNPWPLDLCDLPGPEAQRRENLESIGLLLSWHAWHCRIEARQRGAISRFRTALVDIRDQTGCAGHGVEDVLTYVLLVGAELFAFYLLLWEVVQTADVDSAGLNP